MSEESETISKKKQSIEVIGLEEIDFTQPDHSEKKAIISSEEKVEVIHQEKLLRSALSQNHNITSCYVPKKKTISSKKKYLKEIRRLQTEVVKLQYWVKEKGLRVICVFEGRDAAGKGGVIKRITEVTNPRICRVVALGTPTEKEKSQWYFQRYVTQFPSAGEIVLFDRSWYNRAGVERVMGFCSDEEYHEFLESCPIFESMLVRSGIILLKYWLEVTDEEQENRFMKRNSEIRSRWKLSPMDIESRQRWVEYESAKNKMMQETHTTLCPWNVVKADNKRLARLNLISHLLSQIPYEDLTPGEFDFPDRIEPPPGFVRETHRNLNFVPDTYNSSSESSNSTDTEEEDEADDNSIMDELEQFGEVITIR